MKVIPEISDDYVVTFKKAKISRSIRRLWLNEKFLHYSQFWSKTGVHKKGEQYREIWFGKLAKVAKEKIIRCKKDQALLLL